MNKNTKDSKRGYVDNKTGSVVVRDLQSYEQKAGSNSTVYKETIKSGRTK